MPGPWQCVSIPQKEETADKPVSIRREKLAEVLPAKAKSPRLWTEGCWWVPVVSGKGWRRPWCRHSGLSSPGGFTFLKVFKAWEQAQKSLRSKFRMGRPPVAVPECSWCFTYLTPLRFKFSSWEYPLKKLMHFHLLFCWLCLSQPDLSNGTCAHR